MPYRDRLFHAWLVSVAVSMLIFSVFPKVDLATNRLFWDGATFPLAASPALQMLREAIWFLSLAVLLAALVGAVIAGLSGRPVARLSGRCWTFLLSLKLLGPGLVVNAGLKTYWGRARPDQVEAFGGPQSFTPALMPTDQCLSNCSFTSGEAAASMALAIAVLLFAYRLHGRLPAWAILAASSLALFGGGLRVAFGRHSLSDVVFSWLIVIGVALAVHQVMLRRNLPSSVPGQGAATAAEA